MTYEKNITPAVFAIHVEPIGHWHVFKPKELRFGVAQGASAPAKTGLNLVVQVAQAGSAGCAEYSVENGEVKDEGDGVYAVVYCPSSIGSYALTARFTYQQQEFVSEPAAFDVVRDGEEGISVDARGTSHVYQVRYNWDPGDILADDTDEVKLLFEVMRGIPEGGDINRKQPWLNAFNHITNAERPEVLIESEDGSVSDTIHPVYKGYGVYQAHRRFSRAEVGQGKEYAVRFIFTDPHNGARVTHVEPYHLRAAPPA